MRLALWFGLLLTVLGDSGIRAAAADDRIGQGISAPLGFRRVFVPADRVDEWPRGSSRYVPIDPNEFERLIRVLDNADPDSGSAPAAHVVEADFRARLVGEALLEGEAGLELEKPQPGESLARLHPCNLAIHEAKWQSGRAPAHVGSTPAGETVVLVQSAGRLLLKWSARGNRDTTGAVKFQLDLPHSTVGHLELELPDELQLSVVGGLVTEQTSVPGKKLRRWRIELGSRHRVDVTVSRNPETGSHRQLALLRQRMTYDVSLRGLEVSAEIELDVHFEPLHRLELTLDPSLTPVTARYGDAELTWSLTSGPESDDSKIVLEFAEPILGTGRIVRVTASAPAVVGRPWRLPQIRPHGFHWQEGKATLRIRAPLSLVEFVGAQCRQTGASSLPSLDVEGQIVEVQMFDRDATMDIALAIDEELLHLVTRTVVRLGGSQPIGRLVADLSSPKLPRFQITASVGRGWTIDAVESVPAGSVAQWAVESESGGSSQLSIRLIEPIRPGELKRLVLKGRRVAPFDGEPLQAGDLQMVQFDRARIEKSLIGLDVAPAYRMKLRNAERLRVIPAAELDMADASPFDEVPDALLFDLRSTDPELTVALVPKEPQFACDLRIDADVTASHVVERYLIKCTPLASTIHTLLVRFSVPRVTEPTWSFGINDRKPLRARRLPAREQAAPQDGARGETWIITLPEPASEPFQIRAARATLIGGDTALSLLSLPRAARSSGEIVIHSLDGAPPQIQSYGVEPLAVITADPQRYTTARAAFRYDPLSDADPRHTATVSLVRRHNRRDLSGAICWQCDLVSRYDISGRGQHRVTYDLQNDGMSHWRLRLPDGAELNEIWVDGKKVPRRQQEGFITIDLPSGRRFPKVTLELVTLTRPWGVTGLAAAPLPTSREVPLMRRRWTLWMPPEYQIAGMSRSWSEVEARGTTWRQRLFGLLAREQASSSMEPIDARTRDQLATAMGADGAARAGAEEFLERLGKAASTVEADISTRTLTWEELLQSVEPPRLVATSLLIDRDALVEAGVSPRTRVPDASGAAAVAKGLSLLEQANLALVVHPDALVLTTQTIAAGHRDGLVALEQGVVFRARAGQIASTIDAALLGSSRLVAINDWDIALSSPWSKTATAGATGLGVVGWRALRLEGVDWPDPEETQVARVIQATALGALGWIALLLAAAAGWWWLSRRMRLYLMTIFVCGIVALIVPSAYTPVTSGVVLGLLLSLGLALLGPLREQTEREGSLGSRSKIPASAVTVLILACAGAAVPWSVCTADETETSPNVIPVPAKIHRVLIPMDENREPSGDPYQVPEELYEQMRTLVDRATGTPRGWLLERAVYRGRLVNQPGPLGPYLDRFRAEYDVHVFGGVRRLQLPFGGDDVDLISMSVQVDGHTVPVIVTTDPRGLEVPIEQAGGHRVEIELRLAPAAGQIPVGLQMTIPPVANSRLEIQLPPDGLSVTVPTARGQVIVDETQQTVVALLGPTGTLEVRWHGESDGGASAVRPEVEELYWLRVEPGSVVVDAQLRYSVGDRAVDRLQMAVDPRLRLLTPNREHLPIAKRNVRAGDPTVIDLELDRPLSGEFVLDVSFLLEGTSGVGNLRFPRIEVRSARSTRRWLGVSVSPTLEYQISHAQGGATLSMADFVERWGQVEKPPEMVYRLPRDQTDWTVSTRPRRPAKSVQQQLTLSFGQSRVQYVYEADVEINGGPSFQHHFRAPRNLSIQELSLREAGVERPVRWSRNEDGTITVFLSGAMERRQQIRLRGRLPRPALGRTDVGLVRQLDAEMVSNRLTVFRREGVVVSVEEARGVDPLEPLSGRPDAILGRAVGDFALADDVDTIAISLERNEPSLNAVQLTSLEHSEGTWFARIECQLDVVRGVVDSLRFRLSDEWAGPFELEPPMDSEILELPAEGGRSLVVRPDEPITGRWRLVLHAAIASPSDQPLRVPQATILDVDRLDQYLLLPDSLNREQLAWSTSAVLQPTVPDGFALSRSDLEGQTCYRVMGDRFEAVLRSVEPAADVAQVRLADIRIAWDRRGVCHGVAVFNLEPAGIDVCPLWLPSGWQVTGLWIETVPASARRDESGQWLLNLNSGRLPQRIEVAFAGRLNPRDVQKQSLQLSAPQLGNLPVERTLWAVYAPPWTSDVQLQSGKAVDPARLQLVRLQTTAGLLAQVVDAPTTEPGQQTAFRQDAWSRRLAASIAQLRQLARNSPTQLREQLEGEVALAQEEHAELLRRMPPNPDRDIPPAPATIATQSGEVWSLSADGWYPSVSCMYPGRRAKLQLVYRDEIQRSEFARWCALAALIAIGATLSLERSRGEVVRIMRRYPQTIGVVLGLFWWLWLSPSPVGLLIVVLSLVSAGRLGWRRGGPRGSSVLLLDTPSR